MHTKFERLFSKSLTTLEVMMYDLVVHTDPGENTCRAHNFSRSKETVDSSKSSSKDWYIV